MELKLVLTLICSTRVKGINRTFMELKPPFVAVAVAVGAY